MKTLNEYLSLPYRMEVIHDTEEGGYVVSFPELPGCISSGETIEEAILNAEDAKKIWFETAINESIEIKEPNSEKEYSGNFKLRIPKSLHKTLSEQAKKEGISLNQYCLHLLAK